MTKQQNNSNQRQMVYGVQAVLNQRENERWTTSKAHGDQAVIGPPGNEGGRGCRATAGGNTKLLGVGAGSAMASNDFGLGFRDRSLRRSVRCEAYMPAESGGAPRGGNLGAPGGRKGVAVGGKNRDIKARTGESNTPVFAYEVGSFCSKIPLNPPSAYGYSNTPPSRFWLEAAPRKAVR